jgi:hypothetical protein
MLPTRSDPRSSAESDKRGADPVPLRRLSDKRECWASLPSVELEQRRALPVEREMPDLVSVTESFALRVF